ncbi:MAG: magnesium chelatase subunit D [Alphaproteobacteria bacterium]|nr:magnesium chelatase subunit D [Alphaproteobacteria bacterium]
MTSLPGPPPDLRSADAALAALLLAIDPIGLGGAVLRGAGGPVRDAWISRFRDLLPAGSHVGKLPAYVAADRLLGGLDVPATLSAGRPMFEKGILATADDGALILNSAERLETDKAALIAAAMDSGEAAVQRDGISSRLPARFALIACDESQAEDEAVPSALAERLAFHLDFSDMMSLEGSDASGIDTLRKRMAFTTVPAEISEALCTSAIALGIGSLRAGLFALKAARALAALRGHNIVTAEDAAVAARLVLAPRAVRFPAADQPEEAAEPQEPDAPAPDQDAQNDNSSPGEMTELILEAVRPVLPKGLLEALDMAVLAQSAKSGGGALSAKAGTRRGRPAGKRKGDPRNGARLNLIETLRTAAPWQRLRLKLAPGRTGIQVRREDFRINRYKQRNETTAVFVVDASGSAALQRMAEAKGAVELILADCYVRRDRIALISFRGRKAEVLLPPTRSLQRARRSLADLPGGGGTPLGAAIDQAALIADQVRRGGGKPLLVFLTDGRGNIARDGTADRAAALRDAAEAARALRVQGFRTMVIDISATPSDAARQLAGNMAATYLPLPMLMPAASLARFRPP